MEDTDLSKSRDARQTLLVAALLCIVVVAAYLPVWHAGLLWDDDDEYHTNDEFRWYRALYRIWCTASMWDYYPLTWSVCLLESRLFGYAPLGYHVVNLLLHVLAVILLWRVLLKLRVPCAAVGAALFGVHPMTVASVAWISEIKNTLSFVFYATTVLFYLRWANDESDRRAYRLSLMCFVCALLSKTSGACLPVFLLACVWWLRGRLTEHDVRRVLPFFALSATMSFVTMWFQQHVSLLDVVPVNDDFPTRAATAGAAFWFYVGKSIVPTHLMMIYPDLHYDGRSVASWLPFLCAVATACVAWFGRRTTWGRSLLFAFVFVMGMLLPTLGFVDMSYMRFSRVSDQFAYMALCGLITMYVASARWICVRAGRPGVFALRTLGAVAVLLLSMLTWRQTTLYADSNTFWRDNVAQNPDAYYAWANIGRWLVSRGRSAEALPYYDRCLQYFHLDEAIWYDRGVARMNVGRTSAAMSDFRQALRLEPRYAKAHNNLGVLLERTHRTDEAAREYRAAIDNNPLMYEAYDNLATLLCRQGRLSEAESLYKKALELNDKDPELCNNFGSLRANQGRGAEAALYFRQALEVRPRFAAAYGNLGMVLSHLGRIDEAVSAFENQCRLEPRNLGASNNLGMLYAQQERYGEGLRCFERCVRLDPSYAPGYNNLALIYATANNPHARDPVRAIVLAKKACALTHGVSASMLHTLAAAYASAGRYGDAVRTDTRALALTKSSETALRSHIQITLRDFKAKSLHPRSAER